MAFKGKVEVNRTPVSHDNIPETLSPEDAASRDAVYDWWYKFLTSEQDIDVPVLEEELAWLYAWDNMPPPDVMVCDSPRAVIEEARKYDPKIQSTQWIGLSWDAPRAAFYEAHNKLEGPNGKAMIYHEVMEHVLRMARAGAWDGILFDGETDKEPGLVIVSRRPLVLAHDEQYRPHSVAGPCASWRDGYKLYAYHGVELEEKHIMAPGSISKEELLAENNSERARAVAEILGWDQFVAKVGTRVVDTCVDTLDDGTKMTYELHSLDGPEGRWEMAPKFLKMQSPVLVDGTQPFYFERVHPELRSAMAARKWQIPKSIYPRTEWPTPDECNQDSQLKFVQEA